MPQMLENISEMGDLIKHECCVKAGARDASTRCPHEYHVGDLREKGYQKHAENAEDEIFVGSEERAMEDVRYPQWPDGEIRKAEDVVAIGVERVQREKSCRLQWST